MLGNALIGLREGLEASLVVSILVAFLVRTDRRRELPKVWLGVGIAVLVSVGVTLGLTLAEQALTFEASETLGGSLSIIAVGFVTWMIFWMRNNARAMSSDLQGKLETAIRMGPIAVVVMATLAVGREGLETAVFFFAAAQAAGETAQPLIGFLIGIALAIVLAYLIYRGALKINLAKFFTVTGLLLIFVAAGILAYGVHDLQEAAVLPGINNLAFDLSAQLPPSGVAATLLQGIFNFTPAMTVLQVAAWAAYIVPVMFFYLRALRSGTTAGAKPAPKPAPTQSSAQSPAQSPENA